MGVTRSLSASKAAVWLFAALLAGVMLVCIPQGMAQAVEAAGADAPAAQQVFVGTIVKGDQAVTATDTYAVPAKMASKSTYALLKKNGYVYPCNKNGKVMGNTWKSGSTITFLFVAPDAKKIPAKFNYRYTGVGGVDMKLRSMTFLLKGGKNSCRTIAANNPIAGQATLKAIKNFEKTKVTKIGKYGFAKTGITSIKLPKTLTTLSEGAFQQCPKLKTVVFSSSLKTISKNAFRQDGKLTTLSKFNKTKVATIGVDAFAETGITSITAPKTLKTIGEEAFAATKSLKSVKGLAGSKLQKIEQAAFYQSAVTSLSLPASCKSIGYAAFADANNLKSLVIRSDTLVSGSSQMVVRTAFETSPATTSIKVPAALVNSYKTSPYWKDYADRITAI